MKPTKEDIKRGMDTCLCEGCIGIYSDRKSCPHARLLALEFMKTRIEGATMMKDAVLEALYETGNENHRGVLQLSPTTVCGYEDSDSI